jgi:hypothetical protein
MNRKYFLLVASLFFQCCFVNSMKKKVGSVNNLLALINSENEKKESGGFGNVIYVVADQNLYILSKLNNLEKKIIGQLALLLQYNNMVGQGKVERYYPVIEQLKVFVANFVETINQLPFDFLNKNYDFYNFFQRCVFVTYSILKTIRVECREEVAIIMQYSAAMQELFGVMGVLCNEFIGEDFWINPDYTPLRCNMENIENCFLRIRKAAGDI